MTGSTLNGVPYVVPADALIDYPATSLAQAGMLDLAAEPPFLRLARSAAFSALAGTNWFPIPFSSSASVSLERHIPAGAPRIDWVASQSKLVIPLTGMWLIHANLEFSAVAGGVRGAGVFKNATTADNVGSAGAAGSGFVSRVTRSYPPTSGFPDGFAFSAFAYLTAGEWLQLVGFQTTGAALPLIVDQLYTPMLSAVRVCSKTPDPTP